MNLRQWRSGAVFQAGVWSCQKPMKSSGAYVDPGSVCQALCVESARDSEVVS